MALHLIGETLDKTRSHYPAETSKLVQLRRGIYVDAGDNADTAVLRHAVRIARYLFYPRAYLSAASAVLLGPTHDGRLFLSRPAKATHAIAGTGNHPERPLPHPSIASAVIDDGIGVFVSTYPR